MKNAISSPGIFWWGQIVNDIVWKDNMQGKLWKYADEIPGYGKRYRVAILGRDSEKKDISDDQLEWADVGYPVTAGSGHAGSYQSSNLRKGAFVFGIYKDGINMSEPMILGCYGNNHQIELSQKIPTNNFVPFSGYIEESVAYHDIAPEGSSPPTVSIKDLYGSYTKKEAFPGEGSDKENKSNISNQQEKFKGKQETVLPSTSDCDKLKLGAIQIQIKNFIQDIQNFKNQINSWKYTILKPIRENGQEYSVVEYIQYKIQNVSKFIAKILKNVITDIQKFVERKINGVLKDTYDLLPPDLRATAKAPVETANDLLACLFRKIINTLFKMVAQFLLQIAERFINAPLCAVENLVAGLLGKLTGLISSAINAIMAPLNAILGVIDIVGDIIGFITDVLSFLACEETPKCPEVTAWTPWDGATQFNTGSNISNIINKIKSFALNVNQTIDPNNFNFNLDFSDVFQDTCNVGPIFCGPPTVQFYGGGGTGAAGNAIISATGDILGVDMTSFGFGYTSAPIVTFLDACGNGQSANATAIIAPTIFTGTGTGTGTGGGGTAVTAGGTGGTPLTVNGDPIVVGGTGGTPVTAGGIPLTAGGIPVTSGGTGGTPVTAGGTGGTPVTAGGTGTGGTPLTAGGTGGTPVTAGGTGGTPVTAGGTGGTPVTAGGTGTGGIPIIVGGTGGIPVTAGGISAISGGIPVTAGGISAPVGGTGTGGIPVTAGGIGGTSVTAEGNPLTAGIIAVNAGAIGGAIISVGGTGGIPVDSGGTPITVGGIGGIPVTVGNNPATAGGTPVTSGAIGGTPVTSGAIGGTPVIISNPINTGVVKVIIGDPGFGYLPGSNGDRGGDGRVWSKNDQTTVKRDDGKYDRPYNPGETISVNPGDEVYSGGVTTIIKEPQVITAPEITTTKPPFGEDGAFSGNGQYPVTLEIDVAVIDNPGINYDPKDKIIITPDNGAILEPTFDTFGSLVKIDVINSGIGFVEMPEIKIQTETGYNAKILPVFKVNKDIATLQQVNQDQIISVVDCVGKV